MTRLVKHVQNKAILYRRRMGQNKRNKNQQRTRENSIENQQTAFTHSIEAIVFGRNNINNCKFHEYFVCSVPSIK